MNRREMWSTLNNTENNDNSRDSLFDEIANSSQQEMKDIKCLAEIRSFSMGNIFEDLKSSFKTHAQQSDLIKLSEELSQDIENLKKRNSSFNDMDLNMNFDSKLRNLIRCDDSKEERNLHILYDKLTDQEKVIQDILKRKK